MRIGIIAFSILTMILTTGANCLHGQANNIRIEKEYSDQSSGYYIRIVINEPNLVFDSRIDKYDYENVAKLPDSIKIYLIGQLLNFVTDTSTCSNKVLGYPNPQFDGCYYKKPNSAHFNIGIEALFIINRIAYFKYINRISCFPVLFDLQSRQEVNSDFSALLSIGKHYQDWYCRYKLTGKLPSSYQLFNSGQIKWWGNHFCKPLTRTTYEF